MKNNRQRIMTIVRKRCLSGAMAGSILGGAVALLVATVCANADSQQERRLPPQQSSIQVARTYMNCVVGEDYSCALELFHFPDSYSAVELESDRQAIRAALTLLAKELGRMRKKEESLVAPDVVFLSIDGGDLPYWEKHPKFQRFTFKVQFAKEGEGFIFIDVCQIDTALQIRQVHYGL